MIPLPAARFLPVQPTAEMVFGLARADRSCAIVQLVASRQGDGTTALSRDLAVVASGPAGLRTLLVAVEPSANHWPGGLMNPARVGEPDGAGLRQVGDSRLFLAALAAGEAPALWLAHLQEWRASFDLMVLDQPAMERSAAAVLLAPHVDTTLLVAAAERTALDTLTLVRDRLLGGGGAIRGVLFNRQRQHLPGRLSGVL